MYGVDYVDAFLAEFDLGWELHIGVLNQLEHLALVLVIKRRDPNHHLITFKNITKHPKKSYMRIPSAHQSDGIP